MDVDHQNWYRVYLGFDYQFDQGVASETIIHLQNSTPAGYSASTTVYFDGIQLERAFEGQDRPTTYNQGATLHSPSHDRSLQGGYKYYEW